MRSKGIHVLETNDKAIELYKRFGFEIEGILKNDKFLADGKYYNTIIMGRFRELKKRPCIIRIFYHFIAGCNLVAIIIIGVTVLLSCCNHQKYT